MERLPGARPEGSRPAAAKIIKQQQAGLEGAASAQLQDALAGITESYIAQAGGKVLDGLVVDLFSSEPGGGGSLIGNVFQTARPVYRIHDDQIGGQRLADRRLFEGGAEVRLSLS